MKRKSAILIPVALVTVAAAMGAALFFGAREVRVPGTQSSPLPTAPHNVQLAKRAPTAEENRRLARARNQELVLEIERALVSHYPQQRETAFNFLLPELLEVEPDRVIALVARQEPGEARDALRDEIARQWITKDRDAAIAWMKSFEDEGERKASATVAMRTLAAIKPAQAIYVADLFGIGRDDGSLEHIVQIWATEDMDEASHWLEAQPDDARTRQLRARVK